MPRPTDSNTSLSLTASALAALFPERLAGEERLNALPGWELLGYSASPLALDGAIATHLTATLHNDADQRPLDGLVAEIRQLPGDASAERYQVLLRPWLWWLTLASNNRVFQNLATSDIVTQVFDQHGFSDYQLQLSGSYQPREYCVQYGESDLAFVSRLLEEDGIFWFFTHAAGKHTLVLADSNDAFPP
ncbi:TPA: type VI secretion system tip protein VgrG, partial [Pseudomonas aeruginosa]|nr:type VI secretion system tip protein VgrG [Pseudomonas aeruginosa]